MRSPIGIVAAGVMITAASTLASGQKTSAADVATRMSGTWTINWTLTPALGGGRMIAPSGRGGSTPAARLQRGSASPPTPTLPPGFRSNPTNTEPTPGGGSDLTPAERAERIAMRRIQEIVPALVMTATADTVTIEDEHGEQSCASNGKTDKVRTFSVYVDVTCKWDKDRLRQEYSTTRSKFIRTWSLDTAGHLVLKAKVEGLNQNTPEMTAVYDRS
jgi:hypothetical protein